MDDLKIFVMALEVWNNSSSCLFLTFFSHWFCLVFAYFLLTHYRRSWGINRPFRVLTRIFLFALGFYYSDRLLPIQLLIR